MLDIRSLGRVTTPLIVALALTGCFGTGEPSADDMLQAVRTDLKGYVVKQMKEAKPLEPIKETDVNHYSSILQTAVVSVDKAACAPASGAPGFVCDFRVGYRPGPGYKGEDKIIYHAPTKARFIKSDQGWQVAWNA
jgi:hypothetical protein